jgi:hypothetical protein
MYGGPSQGEIHSFNCGTDEMVYVYGGEVRDIPEDPEIYNSDEGS